MSDNPSFVLRKVNDTTFEDRPVPEISDDEVLVSVKKTGICGSDVHYLVHGRIGPFVVEKPMVLGHESSGVIAKVGKNVTTLKVGDRVALEPGAGCRVCVQCKAGKYQLCEQMKFAATPPYDGTLARFYRLPADLAYPLPDHLTLEDGAMIEPLSVGIHSVASLGQFRANQSCAVFGCGPVGLLVMAVAKALGASRIIAIDIVPERLEFAKKYAATATFLPPKPEAGESKMQYSVRSAALMKQEIGIVDSGPGEIDLVVDASGAEVSIQTAVLVAKTGGILVQVGMGAPEVQFPITTLITKELQVKGSFRYGPGDYALGIALVAQGKIDLKPLITHRYKFEDALEAFELNKAGKDKDGKGVIKIVISGPGVSPKEI